MSLKQGPHFSGLIYNQREDGNLPSLIVSCQPEPISEKGLHHQAHLVFGRISLHAPLNVEPIRGGPFRQLREQSLFLIAGDFVRESYVLGEREVPRSESPPVGT